MHKYNIDCEICLKILGQHPVMTL